jgi:hypothetical protein
MLNCIHITGTRTQSQVKVAFTIELGTAPARYSPLDFQSVVTNIGSAYNTTTGKFTCSHRGVYVFATTLVAYQFLAVSGHIVKNDVDQIDVFDHVANSSAPLHYPSASGQVVMSLDVGDQVWVRNDFPLYFLSTFTGFILY